ncbi:MAG: RNA methyltransferase [Planctomycetaceae bacterium]|nr:RNA methyltransferase [Planctomycetaceae bacterium]
MDRIESPQNPRIKTAAKLRSSRGRHQSERYLIDGVRESLRAIASGAPVETLIVCRELLTEESARELQDAAARKKIEVWDTSPMAFAKIAYGERDEGVVAIARTQKNNLDEWPQPATGSIYLILEGIEKPGNLGAIFRTADAVGVAGILLASTYVSPENSNAIRASLGTVFSVPYVMTETPAAIQWLQKHDLRPFAARVQASHEYWDVSYFSQQERAPVVIALGSEATGLTADWQVPSIPGIRIPQAGIADSLNLSVAAGILLYEVARQRRIQMPTISHD